ncbi:helix-turn-helix domain-containing protein [Streptomyces sp. NPDC088354]|uniref:helix-turn-helix domain-containing protein n=1 Tax=Streptomyces sp. NPDC088354 TaxID=3365856 RepID=UPI0037FA224C
MSDYPEADTAHTSPHPGGLIEYRTTVHLTARQAREAERFFLSGEHGPFSHLTDLAIPYSAALGGFHFTATGQLIGDLLSARVYCDSLTGVSGTNLDQDPIVADLVTSGWIEFRRGKERHLIGPGQICIRDTKASWEFSCAPSTTAHMVSIPRHLVIPRIGSPRILNHAYVADADTPEVRFLVNFLETMEKSNGDLEISTTAQNMAREACATLVSAIVSGHSGPGLEEYANPAMVAAKHFIEKNLGDYQLSPVVIAKSVGVSPRTLHRYFAAADDSVMDFVRRMRLQRAHDELITPGGSSKVSEIATRWHFSDSGHFIRQFKSRYGDTPAAYARKRKGGPPEAASTPFDEPPR